MYNTIKRITFLLFGMTALFACKKKFDDYYARPGNLEPPVYQQLQAKGNFKNFLAVIDKSGYKATLSAAGYWTVFAPTDSAFEQYFKASNLSLDKIDSVSARALVQYLLVYNAFNKDRIDDYQSNTGWIEDNAFRRRTAYYTGFYDDTTATGQAVKAIAANRNGTGLPYVFGDNNNKYLPYFTDVFFAQKKLSASDYNYFYPNQTFTGFNVAGAKVTEQNIAAENGVIHVIDQVITPLPSIEEYLKVKPEYSEFRKLFNKYMATYVLNTDASQRYQVLTGQATQVYVKAYSSALAFSPNNENYQKLQDNDAQQDSWTFFAPKNEALLDYIKNTLLEYYGKHLNNLDKLPPQVITDFLNAHMWQTAVWPSKFSSTLSFLGEEARFNAQTDVIDRQVLSNGIFYGTSKVQEADVFSSVYSRAYLDPKYSMMTRLLDMELKFLVNSPRQNYTLFMMSDAAIQAAGYDYDPVLNVWGYTPPNGTRVTGEAVRQRLLRILNTSLVETPHGELNSLAGSGIIAGYNGEYIKYANNQVISGGTQDDGLVVTVDSSRVVKNGKVYYLNGLLTFSEQTISSQIEKLAVADKNFDFFWQYLKNSTAYTASTGEIVGTSSGTFYTVYVPDSNAIKQAVTDGVLPGNTATGDPDFNPSSQADKLLVNNFIQYHILNKKSIIPNGNEPREATGYETLLKNSTGDILTVTVMPFATQLRDMDNRAANVEIPESNNLSNRTVIHLIDNYLKYNL